MRSWPTTGARLHFCILDFWPRSNRLRAVACLGVVTVLTCEEASGRGFAQTEVIERRNQLSHRMSPGEANTEVRSPD